MARFLCIIFALLVATSRACAHSQDSDKSAAANELQDRIDANDRQIAAMTAYSTRLKQLLASAGLIVGEPIQNLSPQRKKMQQVVPRMHCHGTRLVDAINALARVSEINVSVDWSSLHTAGVSEFATITCDLPTCSVEHALHALLENAGNGTVKLDFAIEDGVVKITTEEDLPRHVLTKGYNVKALLSRDRNFPMAPENLLRVITDTVAPDSWTDAGGTVGSIRLNGFELFVTQTPVNLKAVEDLLEELDIDRQLEHRQAKVGEQEIQIQTSNIEINKLTARCRSVGMGVPPPLDRAMDRVLPGEEFIGTPLSACFQWLRDASGQIICVNWQSLRAAGIESNTPITLSPGRQTLAAALQALLDRVSTPNVRLEYGMEKNVVLVSTREDFGKETVTRVYDIRDILLLPARGTREEIAEQVIRALSDTIDPDSWRDAGGTVGNVRELQGQLIITQTPRTHARIKAWLNARRHRLRQH